MTASLALTTAIRPLGPARPTVSAAAIQRLTHGHPVSPYVALMVVTVAINLVVAAAGAEPEPAAARDLALTATSVNLVLAVLFRQQYLVNALFWIATRAPLSWPLPIRAHLARVYHFGGIHAGAAIAATLWFGVYAAAVLMPFGTAGGHPGWLVTAVTGLIVVDLVVICLCARPSVRERRHDLFEASHRYGGWLALVLFAALTVAQAQNHARPVTEMLAQSPNAWLLGIAILSVVIPWAQLRRVRVQSTSPSDHVVISTLAGGAAAGSFTRLSRSPLGLSHAFATIPDPTATGYRVVISRAGDWTAATIADAPTVVWVRGITTAGVATVARLFRRVVWVATGSGIAPCLPHLLNREVPAGLVWVTRNPERTYGRELLDEIRSARPDAVIWDTDALGKPDLAALTQVEHGRSGAEAVIVISNRQATQQTVSTLRSYGVQAFGPIWDS